MAPTLPAASGGSGAGHDDKTTRLAIRLINSLARQLGSTISRLVDHDLSTPQLQPQLQPQTHERRATAGVGTIPEGYGLARSPPPGVVAGIVVGSVAAFLFALWVLYFCINFGVPGRPVESVYGGGTATNPSMSVVSRHRSRSRRRTGTVITAGGPAAAAAAVIAVEGARRSRKSKHRSRSRSLSRSRSRPAMMEVRREKSTSRR
ncbi:hypothetical protein Micbo1qcDRAFT_162399, partial [Microdochium bolleyi]